MKYFEKVTLNEAEILLAQKLTASVRAEDSTYNEIYLSNQYNYFSDMPTFVYALDNGKMVGLTMLYADEKPTDEVEVHVEVCPRYRRQGIAREMIKRAEKIMNKYGYFDYCFVSEKPFIDNNPDFLKNTNLKIDDHDYHMETTNPKSIDKEDMLNQVLAVREMTKSDIKTVVDLYSEAFAESIESSTKYVTEGFKDKEKINFVLTDHSKIVGYCAIDPGSSDYFFGLFVAKDFCGHGYATFFIKKMMAIRQEKGMKKFVLDVEPNNQAAIHAYQNAGFQIKSETFYLN